MAPIGLSLASSALLLLSQPVLPAAAAFTPPPPGYRLQNDKLDGYSFVYPEPWIMVTSSGNDIFYRNPVRGTWGSMHERDGSMHGNVTGAA